MPTAATVRLLLFILALLCAPLAAQQDVGTVNISSTVGGNAVAPSMTNAAGNTLFTYAWVVCTSTNPNSVFAYTVNGIKGKGTQ